MQSATGGAIVGDAEKTWWKADGDANKISNGDEKLKQAVIKLFLDNFKVLAAHPCQYSENKELEMKIYLILGAILYKSRVRP